MEITPLLCPTYEFSKNDVEDINNETNFFHPTFTLETEYDGKPIAEGVIYEEEFLDQKGYQSKNMTSVYEENPNEGYELESYDEQVYRMDLPSIVEITEAGINNKQVDIVRNKLIPGTEVNAKFYFYLAI